jgi:hypothetical protein
MKLQDIFNKASAHLTSMDGPSLDDRGDSCMYRGENGARCAVGVFISDEHYYEDMEGGRIDGSNMLGSCDRAREAVALSWGQDCLEDKQLDLLSDLQHAHDQGSRCENWSDQIVWALERVAKEHGLEVSA